MPQCNMNRRRHPRKALHRLPTLNQSVNIFRYNSRLCSPWPRSLADPRVGNITHCKQIGVLRVLELHCWSDADEPVVGVCYGS